MSQNRYVSLMVCMLMTLKIKKCRYPLIMNLSYCIYVMQRTLYSDCDAPMKLLTVGNYVSLQ